MSYQLYRVHWRMYVDGVPVETRYSFHKPDGSAGRFIVEVYQQNTPQLQFKTEGPGHEVTTHDIKLYSEVMNSEKLGIWRTEEELQIK